MIQRVEHFSEDVMDHEFGESYGEETSRSFSSCNERATTARRSRNAEPNVR